MLDAIEKIEKYIQGISYEEFQKKDFLVDAVIRQCEVLGEAANRLDHALVEKHPEIPWGLIIGMRNRLIHEYFGVKENIVWATCKEDLPALKKNLQVMLTEISD
jgi:uncharacterized protein with HEPN domain